MEGPLQKKKFLQEKRREGSIKGGEQRQKDQLGETADNKH